MSEALFIYLLAFALAWPLGRYMAAAYADQSTSMDRWFLWLESPLYRGMGVSPSQPMDWKQYGKAMLKLHFVIAFIAIAIFTAQGILPLNPDGVGGMRWDLALHTAASFITNTNQQHYSGQAQLSYFSQLFGIVAMQVITPSAGVAVLVAILRTMLRNDDRRPRTRGGEISVGNFHRDLVRTIVRIMLPIAFIVALLLSWQGVPSTFEGAAIATPVERSAELPEQRFPVGPVAPMVAIKQIGTNGGGWYGPNSSVPLENPTPLSNLVETVSILLLPVALVIMAGYFTGRRRLAVSVLSIMLVMSAALSGLAIWAENEPNPAFAGLAADGHGFEREAELVGELAKGDVAGHLVHLFQLGQEAQEAGAQLPPVPRVHELALVGTGVMGTGIAAAAVQHDLQVHMQDTGIDPLLHAYQGVRAELRTLVQRMSDAELADLFQRLGLLLQRHLSEEEYHRLFLKR